MSYNYGSTAPPMSTNQFDLQPIPTNCVQITGVYLAYAGTAEILPSRLADYVTNAPIPTTRIHRAKKVVNLDWDVQSGATYTVSTGTNVNGPWIKKATGLTYYPTNGTYIETNTANSLFYRVTSP